MYLLDCRVASQNLRHIFLLIWTFREAIRIDNTGLAEFGSTRLADWITRCGQTLYKVSNALPNCMQSASLSCQFSLYQLGPFDTPHLSLSLCQAEMES